MQDLKKYYPNEIEKLEESLLIYMVENDLKLLKLEFPEKWKYLTKKLAHPYEYFNTINDYQKPVDNLKKEIFFRNSKLITLMMKKKERTKQIIKLFNIKSGEELTEIYLKNDVLLHACVFEKLIKVSVIEIGNNTLYCVSLPGYLCEFALK